MLFLDILEAIFATIGSATVGYWLANLWCDRRDKMDADTPRDAQLSPEGFNFVWSWVEANTPDEDSATPTPSLSERMDTLGAFMNEEFIEGIENTK